MITMAKEPRSLRDMAEEAGQVCCPKCRCEQLLTYKTIRSRTVTFRYRRCRMCGHQIITTTTERIVRDI